MKCIGIGKSGCVYGNDADFHRVGRGCYHKIQGTLCTLMEDAEEFLCRDDMTNKLLLEMGEE